MKEWKAFYCGFDIYTVDGEYVAYERFDGHILTGSDTKDICNQIDRLLQTVDLDERKATVKKNAEEVYSE